MTANELISSYKNSDLDSEQIEVWCKEAVEFLLQQAKEISSLKQSYEILFKHRVAQEKEIEQFRFVLRNLTLATSKKIGDLEAELEDCTCQG